MWEEDREALLANPDAIDAELDGLFVDPPHWRKGIGRMLVEQAEHIAARDGAANLWVIANTRALDFYSACGFVTVGEAQTRFRPAPRMRKAIDVAR